MHDPKELRDLARKCRQRANSTFNPTVTEQLRCWAAELADAADAIERTGCEPQEGRYRLPPGTLHARLIAARFSRFAEPGGSGWGFS